MGKKNKLIKFSEILLMPNVYENYSYENPKLHGVKGEIVDLKGKWGNDHFNNNQPITLELACGGGEYTVGLAERYPDRNFIGMDIKGARIWKGANSALDKLPNAAFLRSKIEVIEHFFTKGEVEEIWITFPDPFLRESKSNRRLTSSAFLERYRKVLKEGGLINLKTDSMELFDFTLEVLEQEGIKPIFYHKDIYSIAAHMDEWVIKTKYEEMHLLKGKNIGFIQFAL
jgi:tRNA (guanine-N7-)-methyltransferase